MIRVTITFELSEKKLSKNAREEGLEGLVNLLDNMVRDTLEHAEPDVKAKNLKINVRLE